MKKLPPKPVNLALLIITQPFLHITIKGEDYAKLQHI